MFAAAKYGPLPPLSHGTFLQVRSPDDLSSLQSAPAVAGHEGPTMEAAPSIVEQPTPSMEHAPTVVGHPAESPKVSAELIVPPTIEQVPTVVGPTLTNEQTANVEAPTTPSDAGCPGFKTN